MRPVTCSLIIILPISKPHINFIVFSLCGKKQLYYLMIKRYELDRIKPNAVDKLQPVYIALVHGTLKSQLFFAMIQKCFSSAVFLRLILFLLLLASYKKVDAAALTRRFKGNCLKKGLR